MSATPQLVSKSWHLNDIIKKILFDDIEPIPSHGLYWWSEPNTLHAPYTDGRDGDIFIYRSGKGVIVNDRILNLDRDSND